MCSAAAAAAAGAVPGRPPWRARTRRAVGEAEPARGEESPERRPEERKSKHKRGFFSKLTAAETFVSPRRAAPARAGPHPRRGCRARVTHPAAAR
jgi:hypothetical protein